MPTKPLGVPLLSGETQDMKRSRQLAVFLQLNQGRTEISSGQIAGCAKNDQSLNHCTISTVPVTHQDLRSQVDGSNLTAYQGQTRMPTLSGGSPFGSQDTDHAQGQRMLLSQGRTEE